MAVKTKLDKEQLAMAAEYASGLARELLVLHRLYEAPTTDESGLGIHLFAIERYGADLDGIIKALPSAAAVLEGCGWRSDS